MKTVTLNQDLGAGWRLISITQPTTDSKILTVVLTFNNKVFTIRFDVTKGISLDPIALTSIQLHIIETSAIQFLR